MTTMIIINGTVAEIYQNMFLKDLQQNKKKGKKSALERISNCPSGRYLISYL